jgi:hypothetical protein
MPSLSPRLGSFLKPAGRCRVPIGRRVGSHGGESEGEHGDGEHQGQRRHDEPFGVADAEVADDGADEVGDQGGGGDDAQRLQPQPKQNPGGAGELKGSQDGEVADRDADGPADDRDRALVLAELT